MRPQRPVRAVFGGLLVVASVAIALTVYSRIGDRQEVLAVTRTVLAGEQLTDADLKEVSISSDGSFASVPAASRSLIVGQYAKVRLVSGSLLVTDSVQSRPLVDPDRVLMSVPVPLTGVPAGLREGSRLVLIVTPATETGGSASADVGRSDRCGGPSNLGELVGGSSANGASSTVALSVEVPPAIGSPGRLGEGSGGRSSGPTGAVPVPVGRGWVAATLGRRRDGGAALNVSGRRMSTVAVT